MKREEAVTYEVTMVRRSDGKRIMNMGKSEGFTEDGAIRFANSQNERYASELFRYEAVKITTTIESV